MLKIHFFNVAEGDSILLEYEGGKRPFRVLVDTGRAVLPESAGSLRHTADYYLRKLGTDFIDALVITHLHVDHVGNFPKIADTARIGSIYSSYFPKDPSIIIPEVHSERKAARELPQDLNTFAAGLMKAVSRGTELKPVSGDMSIPLGDEYGSIRIRMPSEPTLDFQNDVCDRLFSGGPVTEEEIYRAAKSRNHNSLRLLVRYAGRTAALDGDYYAADAEKEAQEPCDILKVAHHGDRKSMTDRLASMLRPKYAVISCMREYDAKKDRPSQSVADALRKYGAEIFYTDCFAEENRPPAFHEEVLLTIDPAGRMKVV